MSLFKTRLDQLNEYWGIQKTEKNFLKRILGKSKERDEVWEEYNEFKKIFLTTIDTIFNVGKSKIVIRPKVDKKHFYEILLEDDDFKNYYKCNIIGGKDLEIQAIEL